MKTIKAILRGVGLFLVVLVAGAYFRADLERLFQPEVIVREIEKIVRVPVDARDVDYPTLAAEMAAEHKLEYVILESLIEQESAWRADAYRFEPHLYKRFKGSEEQRRVQSSSWGLTQVVYGFHKKRCGLKSYSDLLIPETNLRCGIAVLKDCLKRHEKLGKLPRLRKALECYNGSKKYSIEVMDLITGKLLTNLEM